MIEIKKYPHFLEKAVVTILLFLFTFPKFEPDYGIGLDTSYAWALNFLLSNNYALLQELVYPIGILGFLKMPTTEGHHLLFALAFYAVLKIGFIASLLKIIYTSNPERKAVSILILSIISLFASIDFLMIGVCVIQSFLYLEKGRMLNLSIATALAYIGLCVKSSIGISGFSVIFMCFSLDLYFKRNYSKALRFIAVSLSISTLLGLLILNDFEMLYQQFVNAINLSSGYADALSLHPENNWYLLSGFITSIFIVPWICKNKNAKIIFLLFLPCIFAVWKHAMAREDMSHYQILFYFLFLFWGILILCSTAKIKTLFCTAALSILLFWGNMSKLYAYSEFKLEEFGISNFITSVLKYKTFEKKYSALSLENIKPSKLDNSVLTTIGRSKIDVYPWELSYIPANDLHWRPRKTLQGGAYSRWLDSISAQDFDIHNKAEYLLFHYVKDQYGGDLGSIDNRYLLNDNPKTIFNILNHYSVKIKTNNYLLFKKNTKNNFTKITGEKQSATTWNTWVNVPPSANELLRIKVFSKTSAIGKLKNFLYKSEPYFIDYELEGNRILSFRYIPENAKDGIWINPFIRFPGSNILEEKAVKVRFRCTENLFNNDSIHYQFERIFLNSDKSVNDLFGKTIPLSASILIQNTNTFENAQNTLIDKSFAYSGTHSNKVESGAFSFTLEYNLDTLWKSNDSLLSLETSVRYRNPHSKANMVISISDSKADSWEAINLENNKTQTVWEYAQMNKLLHREKYSTGILKLYIFNDGPDKIYIDNFKMILKKY